MLVAMIKNVNDNSVANVKKVVGDEDSTAIAKARREVRSDIEKKSDKNHIHRILNNDLFALKKINKVSTKTVQYIKKNFAYMCSQNQGNTEGIRKGLKAMYSHPFDDHRFCGAWCKKDQTKSNIFKSLPYRKPLTDTSLKASLTKIFDKFHPKADQLADLSSTQLNESFNNSAAGKAPKNKYFGGSDSLDFRVAAAVSQTNEGCHYLLDVS